MNDREYLKRAIELSRQSTPSPTSYRVGAVVVTSDGAVFEGYTHESDDQNHAEEEALAKAIKAGARLTGATIYASMEPCSTRQSKPVSCSELIIGHGLSRVVYALAEPTLLALCEGADKMRHAGIEVVEMADLSPLVREINAHLLKK